MSEIYIRRYECRRCGEIYDTVKDVSTCCPILNPIGNKYKVRDFKFIFNRDNLTFDYEFVLIFDLKINDIPIKGLEIKFYDGEEVQIIGDSQDILQKAFPDLSTDDIDHLVNVIYESVELHMFDRNSNLPSDITMRDVMRKLIDSKSTIDIIVPDTFKCTVNASDSILDDY